MNSRILVSLQVTLNEEVQSINYLQKIILAKIIEKGTDYFNVKTRNVKLELFYVVDTLLQEIVPGTNILTTCEAELSDFGRDKY